MKIIKKSIIISLSIISGICIAIMIYLNFQKNIDYICIKKAIVYGNLFKHFSEIQSKVKTIHFKIGQEVKKGSLLIELYENDTFKEKKLLFKIK